MGPDSDRTEALRAAVERAGARGEALRIVGTDTKGFLCAGPAGRAGEGRLLSVAEHCGVVEYRPGELVMTARCGTPLREIERILAREDQQLPFEPPRFRGGGTLGGAVACGLGGPARPWRGAARDVVLGVEMVNGRGERLRFGGQVMKNVAGYDLSRLQVGAFGTLGLLLSVSIKVLPRPHAEETRCFDVDAAEALRRCRDWARHAFPISATAYLNGRLRVRLSGAESAVAWAGGQLGGTVETTGTFWEALRDHRLEHFAGPGLWRCSLPPAATEPLEDCLVGWAGAERWWRPDAPADAVRALVAAQGGHARPFDGTFGMRAGRFVSAAEAIYSARLREAFDPAGIFNPSLTRDTAQSHAD